MEQIKNENILYNNELNALKNETHKIGIELEKFQGTLYLKEFDIISTNLNNLISQINESSKIIVPIKLSYIDLNNKIIPLNYSQILIALSGYLIENNFNKMIINNVKIPPSLDLLFIVDITLSMETYLEIIKINIKKTINEIVKNFPEIELNLGFIGYRDYEEEYIDIDFTQDHTKLTNIIDNVVGRGGIWYIETPVDSVTFALDLALKKNWKSYSKLIVFIADSPGTGGNRWGSFGRKEKIKMGEMIGEMAEQKIALFCLRINNSTDEIFQIFEDAYNERIPYDNIFYIIDDKNLSFSETIVNYTIEAYEEQITNKQPDCLLQKRISNKILKSIYGINNNFPDKNLRFILGKCSPVLLVPGVYATKLKVEFNCKGLATEEKNTTLKNIRLFCGNDVCKNEKKHQKNILFFFLYPFLKMHLGFNL